MLAGQLAELVALVTEQRALLAQLNRPWWSKIFGG